MIKIKNYEVIKAFGQKVRDLRTSQNLSQEELANLADVPLSQIGRIERAEINPTLSTIYAIATALQTPMSSILYL
ncbi:helix-turn-helix domain-containing protein [Pedobacter hartonius]|uniref:helix-turn-helix domain-containing protein n=1 Tax=Pedobacter hartonius TaxID=425514 RepID=UPI001C319BD3|nr:helix-turn-helix transcriptional regulator [Pedobacter hartonius]